MLRIQPDSDNRSVLQNEMINRDSIKDIDSPILWTITKQSTITTIQYPILNL